VAEEEIGKKAAARHAPCLQPSSPAFKKNSSGEIDASWRNRQVSKLANAHTPSRLLSSCLSGKVQAGVKAWNTKGESITVLLTSCLTGLESAV